MTALIKTLHRVNNYRAISNKKMIGLMLIQMFALIFIGVFVVGGKIGMAMFWIGEASPVFMPFYIKGKWYQTLTDRMDVDGYGSGISPGFSAWLIGFFSTAWCMCYLPGGNCYGS